MSNAIEILDSKPVPHTDYATPARSPSSMAFATWATDIVQTFFSSDAYARTKGVLEFSLCLAAMLRLRIKLCTRFEIRDSPRDENISSVDEDRAKFAKISIGITYIFPIQNCFPYKIYSLVLTMEQAYLVIFQQLWSIFYQCVRDKSYKSSLLLPTSITNCSIHKREL